MEHHSNIVPWQMVCEQTGATLGPLRSTTQGELDLDAFERLLGDRTRLVAVSTSPTPSAPSTRSSG